MVNLQPIEQEQRGSQEAGLARNRGAWPRLRPNLRPSPGRPLGAASQHTCGASTGTGGQRMCVDRTWSMQQQKGPAVPYGGTLSPRRSKARARGPEPKGNANKPNGTTASAAARSVRMRSKKAQKRPVWVPPQRDNEGPKAGTRNCPKAPQPGRRPEQGQMDVQESECDAFYGGSAWAPWQCPDVPSATAPPAPLPR